MQKMENYEIGTIGNLYFIHNGKPDDFPIASGMLTTNETGAFLWNQLDREISSDDLSKALADYYEIDLSLAKEDTGVFLEQLKKIGALKM